MTVDWAHFSPWASLGGGVLLGIASAAFIVLNGRILGISGILGGLLRSRAPDAGWRISFLLGLVCAPLLWMSFATPVAPRIEAGWGALVIAGMLVGAGTRFAGGCTSGHGVCGLSRLSPRSAVATAAFMASGFVTVALLRHLFA